MHVRSSKLRHSRNQPLRGRGRNGFDNLENKINTIKKMAGSCSSCGDFQDQWKEKAEKNAQCLFCGKLFVMKLSFEEVNIVFFMAERLACFEPTKAARFMKKLQVHSEL